MVDQISIIRVFFLAMYDSNVENIYFWWDPFMILNKYTSTSYGCHLPYK